MVYEIYLYLYLSGKLSFPYLFLLQKQRLVFSYGLKKRFLFLIWWTFL